MVAAMGRRVVAVDPILSNLALINQSLQRANNTKHVSFVSNPIPHTSPIHRPKSSLNLDNAPIYYPSSSVVTPLIDYRHQPYISRAPLTIPILQYPLSTFPHLPSIPHNSQPSQKNRFGFFFFNRTGR